MCQVLSVSELFNVFLPNIPYITNPNFMYRIIIISLLLSTSARAQQEEIKSTINIMFESMAKSDSAKFHSVMDDQCNLKSVITKADGSTLVVDEPFKNFLAFVGKPRNGKIEERLHSYDIKIDGEMAMAWTPYTFYVDEKISHCGVNVFMLAKRNNRWKILSICDTRRKTCQ